MKKLLTFIAALSLACSVSAETFEIDTSHAGISFSVKHMMISNAKGTFNTFQGTLDYDMATKTLTAAEGVIETASIDTNNKKRDDHLKNADYFNVEKYPKMTFKSSSVKKTGEGTFEVSGVLNLLGVDHKVVIPVTINGPVKGRKDSTLIGLECNTVLNRRTIGITHSPSTMIADEVKISIEAEAKLK
jgi:polyisoprenoid-binding protein YceI